MIELLLALVAGIAIGIGATLVFVRVGIDQLAENAVRRARGDPEDRDSEDPYRDWPRRG